MGSEVAGEGVRLDRVRKEFGRLTAVADFSLRVARGEFVVSWARAGVGRLPRSA